MVIRWGQGTTRLPMNRKVNDFFLIKEGSTNGKFKAFEQKECPADRNHTNLNISHGTHG